MKKRTIFLIIALLISLLAIICNVRGASYCQINNFDTSKDIYYNDEQIKVNASWDLQYDVGDISFIQIQMFNDTNDMVWSSSQYSNKGQNEETWIVSVQDLGASIDNDYNIFYIKFYYFLQPVLGDPEESFLLTLQIKTIKRNVSCEIKGFKDYINIGETLHIIATFYNTTGENKTELASQLIFFKVSFKGTITFNKTYITNSSGMIEIVVAPINLTEGINLLTFETRNSQFFNGLTHEITLVVMDKTMNQNFNDSENEIEKEDKNNDYMVVSIISISCLSIIFFGFLCYNNYRKARKQKIVDISFRY